MEGGEESRVLESISDWSRVAIATDGNYFAPRVSPSAAPMAGTTIAFFSFANKTVHTVVRHEKPAFLGMSVSQTVGGFCTPRPISPVST